MNNSIRRERKKKVVGLFAGIGGLELGFSRSGYSTELLCEIDPGASRVLQVQFPKAKLIPDVRKIETVGNCDVLCAGFPCQDLSSSGQKAGINGDQSSLVDEVFRILGASNANWVVIENVRFMLHLNGGEAMKRIVEGFERLGYNWAYRVMDSNAFGVPQRRHRVYFVASRKGDPRDVLLSGDQPRTAVGRTEISVSDHIGFYWTEGMYATGLSCNSIPPLKSGSTIGIPSPPAILFPDGQVGTPDIQDAERLQGFDPGWTKPAEEVSKASARWRLLGNSVTVPVSEWLAGKIRSPERYDSSGDRPLRGKWPNAAWSVGGVRYEASVSDWPVSRPPVNIGDFLNHAPKPLSRRAVTGFLDRANRGNLKFPVGFLDALSKFSMTAS